MTRLPTIWRLLGGRGCNSFQRRCALVGPRLAAWLRWPGGGGDDELEPMTLRFVLHETVNETLFRELGHVTQDTVYTLRARTLPHREAHHDAHL